jgi:hydroxyacyl-ACP dehydratase HTD2-like protein with hotdog domain
MRFSDLIGQSVYSTDTVAEQMIFRMSHTLGVDMPPVKELPPLWHWALFQEWLPTKYLGEDGHGRTGAFLPYDEELTARMWAGGRVSFHERLLLGEKVSRRSTLRAISEKMGSSGRLLFATVLHEITGPRGLAIREEQDIVYRGRSAGTGASKTIEPKEGLSPTIRRSLVPDSVLLFRYSALTGNTHRIHFDHEYSVSRERYPDLVVHGPLQATLLVDLAVRHNLGRLTHFNFRAQRPAFANRPLTLEGSRFENAMKLCSRDSDGMVCIRADAAFYGSR